jgi:hypothetical protein
MRFLIVVKLLSVSLSTVVFHACTTLSSSITLEFDIVNIDTYISNQDSADC